MPYNSDYYAKDSRYLTNLQVVKLPNGMKVPLTLDLIRFLSSNIDYYYTVPANEQGRVDLISFKIYGATYLWWAIAAANHIDDLIGFPEAGEVISIPSFNAIKRYM